MAVTTDDNISSYVTEAKITMPIQLNMCTACASIPYKLDLFLHTCDKQNTQCKRTSMKEIAKRTQYEINGNLI